MAYFVENHFGENESRVEIYEFLTLYFIIFYGFKKYRCFK